MPFESGAHVLDGMVLGQSSIKYERDMSVFAKSLSSGDEETGHKRKSKIICTMGPSCWDVPVLEKLIAAGMNCARLNFSHGDHEAHGATVGRIHQAMQKFPGRPVALLLDTKGPEIRSGFFTDACGGKVNLKGGSILRLTTDYAFKGDEKCIACSYEKLPTSVKPGQIILMADGTVSLEVKECGDKHVDCTVLNDATIGERKNMNLPGVQVDLPVIGEKDTNDILNFAIPQGCQYIAASFVQRGEDIDEIRELLGRRGRHIHIIAKIENEAGLKNFDAILEKADGIMVARGDLGMEIPTEKVFLAQKTMIGKCNLKGKLVVTATQMLESMCGNPRPTRAEASDVANAVLDGTDCVMLSGETAGGKFPLEAVNNMRRICEEAENAIEYDSLYESVRSGTMAQEKYMSVPESVCSAAVKAVIDTNAALVIVLTETGSTAKLVAKYRPSCPIVALSAAESTVKHLCLIRGVIPLQVPSFQGTDAVLKQAMLTAKSMGLCNVNDTVVCVHGVKEEVSGHSNLLKILSVPDGKK